MQLGAKLSLILAIAAIWGVSKIRRRRWRTLLALAPTAATAISCLSLTLRKAFRRFGRTLTDPVKALKWVAGTLALGVFALLLTWAWTVVSRPPVFVERIRIPEALKGEDWLPDDLHLTILNEIGRIRAAVSSDRDPTFEALAEAPTVSFKAESVEFDFDKSLVQPLRLVFGMAPVSVRTALSCTHPRCLRSQDGCDTPLAAPKAEAGAPPVGNLCLRVTVDVVNGSEQRRFTTRLRLNNDTYRSELRKEFRRVAEQVVITADPVTAALHHLKQSSGELVRPISVSDARSAATEAAVAAERKEFASRCWARNVLARIATLDGDVAAAARHLGVAAAIPIWRQIWSGLWPGECYQLTAYTRFEIDRRILRATEGGEDGLPVFLPTSAETALASQRLAQVARGAPGEALLRGEGWWEVLFGASDHHDAAMLAIAEAGVLARKDTLRARGDFLCRDWAGGRVDWPTRATAMTTVPWYWQDRREALASLARNEDRERLAIVLATERIATWSREARRDVAAPDNLAAAMALRFVRALGLIPACIGYATELAGELFETFPGSARVAEQHAQLLRASAMAYVERDTVEPVLQNEVRARLFEARLRYKQAIELSDDLEDMDLLVRLAGVEAALETAVRPVEGTFRAGDAAALTWLGSAVRRYDRSVYPERLLEVEYRTVARWAALAITAADSRGSAQAAKQVKDEVRGVANEFAQLNIRDVSVAGAADLLKPSPIAHRIHCTARAFEQADAHRLGRLTLMALLERIDAAFDADRLVRPALLGDLQCATSP